MNVLQEITVPQESVNDQSLIVLELFFKDGEKVSKGALIAELETSKTAISVEAETDGYIQYFCKVGDDLLVNALIARITDEVPDIKIISAEQKKSVVNGFNANKPKAKESIFSKEAIKLMASSSIHQDVFAGLDFVSKTDVEAFINGGPKTTEKITRKFITTTPVLDDLSKVILQKIPSFKKKEIEYLQSVQSAGLVSVINTMVSTDGVTDYLNQHLRYFKNSLLPVIVAECAKLLKKYNSFNAYLSGENIAYYKNVHIGFAVDMEKGLKVLKVSNTNEKSIQEIEEEIFQRSNEYLDDKIKTETLTDITFTVTDLSGEGVSSFTPLINMKNSAILGVSAIDEKLNRCILSLAFDHRVTEGKQAAIFLSELKERIESYHSIGIDNALNKVKLSAITCYKCYKKLTEDLSDTGFAKCITPSGKEAYICQSCFKGF